MTVKKIFINFYICAILFVMYLPIFLFIFYSFTETTNIGIWNGFSCNLYRNLFFDKKIGVAFCNTLIISIVSSIISIFLGTIGAIGSFYTKKKFHQIINALTQLPLINAEIIIALSLTVLFVIFSKIFHFYLFSFFTILIGHICISLPFVYFPINSKLQQIDSNLYEAAMDLGASSLNVIFKIIIPQILSTIFLCFLLVLSLSFDDFIITAFLRGPGLLNKNNDIETLTTLIQAKIKKGPIPPEIRAFSTIFFLLILIAIVIMLIHIHKNSNRKNNI